MGYFLITAAAFPAKKSGDRSNADPPGDVRKLKNSPAPASPALALALSPPTPIVILPSKTAQVEATRYSDEA